MPSSSPLRTLGRAKLAVVAALGLALTATLTATPALAETPTPPSGQLTQSGNVGVHDPTMTYDPVTGLYILADSHNAIRTATSKNGPWTVHPQRIARAPWTFTVPNSSTLWAPDITRIGDTFYYYYAQSSFGSSNSAIGVKTTKTPHIPSSYVDLGRAVVTSGTLQGATPSTINYNAIDPDMVQDADGAWWLSWGSFWDGIVVQKLGADLVSVVGEPTLIASRRADDNPIEAPTIFYRDGYYYLTTSWDKCCSGAASTYKTTVGRSTSVTGPYVDQNGVRLDEGGGTVILDSRQSAPGVAPAGLYRAPGGADVYTEDGVHYLVYHAYRGPNGLNTLGVRPMAWRDGWPSFPEAGGGSYDLTDGSRIRLVSEAKPFTMPTIGRVAGPAPAFGTAIQLNGSSPVAYVDMPDAVVSGLDGDFTISTWLKRGVTGGNDWARIFDFGDSTGNFMYLTPASAAAPTGLRFDVTTPASGGGTLGGSTGALPVSTAWTHIAVSASGTTATLWVNGQAVGTNPSFTVRPADLGHTVNNWIGRSQFSADPGLNGTIDDFNIFSRALTPAQMMALTTAPGGGPDVGGGDVAWYRFDEAEGAQVTDSSPIGNTAEAVVPVTTESQLQNPVRGTQCLTSTPGAVIQSTCVDRSAAQTWRLDEAANGLYRLVSMSAPGRTPKCLAVADDSGTVGTPIHVTPCDEAPRNASSTSTRGALQMWSIEDTGHGFLRFSNPVTGLALEIDNDGGAIRTDVVGAVRAIRPIANLDPPQQWLLEHVG